MTDIVWKQTWLWGNKVIGNGWIYPRSNDVGRIAVAYDKNGDVVILDYVNKKD